MQIKISKTLEAIIARAAFNTTKAGLDHSLKDFLTLELLREEGSLAYQLLSSRLKDWELYQIRLRIEREMLAGQQNVPQSPEEYYRAFTEELRACSGAARSVSTAHALRAIVGDRTTATSRVLEMYGITGTVVDEDLKKFAVGDDFRTEIQVHMLGLQRREQPEEKTSSHLLDKFGVNLTRMAREGKIDPVVGREQEIERVVQILSRRKKNNPILIGEAGVGKSAIVEGLALRMAADEVPATIRGKRLYSLDVSSLLAGTKYRGEFEERMQRLLEELRRKQDSILFIDEIHTIAGAGSTQGSLDTANILKPALARGELQVIGATTLDEYREDIESDPALERRFQKILVETRFGRGNPANPAQHRTPLRTAPRSALLGRSIAGLRRPDRALHYRPQLSGQGDRRAGRSRLGAIELCGYTPEQLREYSHIRRSTSASPTFWPAIPTDPPCWRSTSCALWCGRPSWPPTPPSATRTAT